MLFFTVNKALNYSAFLFEKRLYMRYCRGKELSELSTFLLSFLIIKDSKKSTLEQHRKTTLKAIAVFKVSYGISTRTIT